ncbi:hypothetical protein M1328_00720 [Patescibacteria group bacterium]|nr:hypothetical protein [Patescibacteria group bacterium]
MKKLKKTLLWLFLHWQIVLFILLLVYSIVDYYDFHIATGYGLLSKLNKPNPVEAFTALLLIFTLYETIKTRKEAVRQTEITLRPYMRLSWVTTPSGEDRIPQGITNTCITVSNNGNGLMRRVQYSVEVNGKNVGVRNHALIIPNSSTVMVYDDLTNKLGPVLGNRNDINFEKRNNEIIKTSEIKIYGSYRDIEGRKYRFSFISDAKEQSWFREKYIQQLTNKNE